MSYEDNMESLQNLENFLNGSGKMKSHQWGALKEDEKPRLLYTDIIERVPAREGGVKGLKDDERIENTVEDKSPDFDSGNGKATIKYYAVSDSHEPELLYTEYIERTPAKKREALRIPTDDYGSASVE